MADNSMIRAPGVGKNSKRHDLDGTPGLANSDLQYGDVQKFEQGKQTLRHNEGSQGKVAPSPLARQGVQPAPSSSMAVPDPVAFATKKLGGTAAQQGNAGTQLEFRDKKRWLPLLQRMAASPTSSGLLQRAYIQRLQQEINTPLGGRPVVLRQRDFDERLRNFGR